MAKRFWTADCHFGHGNICIYSNRPGLHPYDVGLDGKFVSAEAALAAAERMNEIIVREMNSRVHDDDIVVHVGDFCTRGRAKGTEGLRLSYKDYLARLNGTWVLLEGNHDGQGKVKTAGRDMFCAVGSYPVFVSHHPSDDLHQPPALIAYAKETCAFQICGHVHERWLFKWDGEFLNINVGVDQHKMRPIDDGELVNLYRRALREH